MHKDLAAGPARPRTAAPIGLAITARLPPLPRRWQVAAIERLASAGHRVGLLPGGADRAHGLDAILRVERLRQAGDLTQRVPLPGFPATTEPSELVLDLTEDDAPPSPRTLVLRFDGGRRLAHAAARIASGGLPTITLDLDGATVAEARPMVGDRMWLTRSLDDVVARAVDLIEQAVRRFAQGELGPIAAPPHQRPAAGLPFAYAANFLAGTARRAWHRARYHPFHWRVGYRFDGGAWTTLPDGGARFYADPFAVEFQGRPYLFVEELEHARPTGFISVAELEAPGRFGTPRPVLVEPFHLSYPQVFAHGGQMWMIPETMATRQVLLYRAERFPDRWVRAHVLVDGHHLSDATLVEHGGRFWLFAADQGGAGSPSDRMAVFHAAALTGPFEPHRQNPVVIDRARARPGGAFLRDGDTLLLPVQDGTTGYGGGLGLLEITRLDENAVTLGALRPLDLGAWPTARHTYNHAGALEVVDGAVLQRR